MKYQAYEIQSLQDYLFFNLKNILRNTILIVWYVFFFSSKKKKPSHVYVRTHTPASGIDIIFYNILVN